MYISAPGVTTTPSTTTITTTTIDIAGKIQIFFENIYLAYHDAKPSFYESRIPDKLLTEIPKEFQYYSLISLTRLQSEKLKDNT